MTQKPATAASLTAYDLYVDGRYVEAQSPQRLPVVDPATGERWATIVDAGAADVDAAVAAAQRAFETSWAKTTPATRGRLLNRL
ncbi:MAG: aldehyde dehydrogenase family protein, partial [Vulcanimicrobiaceae bacterium]